MWCLLPPGLYFSIKNGSIWPAWPDIPSGVENLHSPRTSILTFSQKTCFSGTSFLRFVLRIACQNDFKKCPCHHIWSSKIMPCRLFVVFSETLFLKDPTMILAYVLMLAAPGNWKRPAPKHLKPFSESGSISEKTYTWKSCLGANTTKTSPLEV